MGVKVTGRSIEPALRMRITGMTTKAGDAALAAVVIAAVTAFARVAAGGFDLHAVKILRKRNAPILRVGF